MIIDYTSDCPLCRLVQDREIRTELLFENEIVLVTYCIICRVPMAVLKAHRPGFTSDETEQVRSVFLDMTKDNAIPIDRRVPLDRVAGGAFLKENTEPVSWIIDFQQRKIPDHAHCHLRPHPFPGTRDWESLRKES